MDNKEIYEIIINAGFDGIIVNNVNANEELKYYVVFNPNQIEIEDDDYSEKDLKEYYESFKKAFLGENAVENDQIF